MHIIKHTLCLQVYDFFRLNIKCTLDTDTGNFYGLNVFIFFSTVIKNVLRYLERLKLYIISFCQIVSLCHVCVSFSIIKQEPVEPGDAPREGSGRRKV
jgi:hypothetical protein